MPPTPTTQRMGELHEKFLAGEVFHGYRTKASGATPTDKADGANHHDDLFAFRWDGKSTKGASITVTLAMVEKICEQAGGERPALGLRWYGNEALTKVLADWVAVQAADFSEMLAELGRLSYYAEANHAVVENLAAENARLKEENERLRAGEPDTAPDDGARSLPGGPPPQLPWTVIYIDRTHPDRLYGHRYDAAGHLSAFKAGTVRVERSMDDLGRPRLIVDDLIVRAGDLIVDGVLTARVWPGNPAGEMG